MSPNRGEIWTANLDPTVGHEQAGQRPVLVISSNITNHGPSTLIVVCPVTTTNRHIPLHVPIAPPEGGVKQPSVILCDHIRAISKDRLRGRAWGAVSPATLRTVEDRLAILLEI